MIYRYQAYKADKLVSQGTIEAGSERTAEEALYLAGFKYVLNLHPQSPRPTIEHYLPSLFGVKTPDIIDFSRQLAAFIESGTSLHASLELLEQQATKPAVKKVISGIILKLEEGASFSQAIKEYPEVFPHSYLQVIQSSEKGGEMEKGLKQIADYLENRAAIADRIRRALAYPLLVILMAIGVVVLMVTTVLPSILKLFASFQAELPRITLITLGMINFFTIYKFHMLAGILLLISLFLFFRHLPAGRLALDRLILRVPAIGTIIIQHNLGLFCRTASMLLNTGLPLPNIMDVTIQSASNNRIINRALSVLKDKLMQGEGLARPMSEDNLFPPMMVRMISVGEQTGTLDSSLATLATYYEEHSNKRIQTMITMIEPTLTIVIGIGIAFIMYSMITPIYSIMKGVH